MRTAIAITIFFVFALNQNAFSQSNEKVLTFEQFMSLVKEHHPIAKQAELQLKSGKANLQKSRGNFDPQVFSDLSQKNFKNKEYYKLSNTGLKIPTWFGAEFKAGYEQNEGYYLNPENYVPNSGLWYAGVSIPIGKGLFIDKRRAELKKAKLYNESSILERRLIYNDLLYESGKIYWNWFKNYNVLLIYENAVKIAEVRLDAVKKATLLGAKPMIDTVEAGIQLQNRQLNLQQAQLDFKNSTALLSVYLWADGVVPLEIEDSTSPPKSEKIQTVLPNNEHWNQLNSLADKHPFLQQYALKIDQLKIDKKLKIEKLKPKLNLNYNALTQPTTSSVFSNFNTNNYKWGFEFKLPIFLRKERGDLQLTNVKIDVAEMNLVNKTASLTYKAQASINELQTTYNQAKLYKKTVIDYTKLVDGEKQKFAIGESSLFMVNYRETAFIKTQLKYVELIAKNQKAKLSTDYALGILMQDK